MQSSPQNQILQSDDFRQFCSNWNINQIQDLDIEEKRFILYYASTFKDTQPVTKDAKSFVYQYLSCYQDLCTNSEDLIFFFHSISKFCENQMVDPPSDFIQDILNKKNILHLLCNLSPKELIQISVYVQKLLNQDTMAFVIFFEDNLKQQLTKSFSQQDNEDLILLLNVLVESGYQDLSFVEQITQNLKDIENINQSDLVNIIYLCKLLNYTDKDFLLQVIKTILQKEDIKHLTDLQKKDYLEKNEEYQNALKQEKNLQFVYDPIKKSQEQVKINIIKAKHEQYLQKAQIGIKRQMNIDPSRYVELLFIAIEFLPQESEIIKNLYFRTIENLEEVTRENFVELWLIISLINKNKINIQTKPLVKNLKDLSLQNTTFNLKHFSTSEILKIFISLSSLKHEDYQYVHVILNLLMEEINIMSDSELIQFFISFYTYSNLFENYYILIHDQLVNRLDTLDMNQLQKIKQIIVLKNDLFINSPFKALLQI